MELCIPKIYLGLTDTYDPVHWTELTQNCLAAQTHILVHKIVSVYVEMSVTGPTVARAVVTGPVMIGPQSQILDFF